jgi:hypothetical protein
MQVKIVIKNVDGSQQSDNCIAELSRAGAPKDSVQIGTYSEINKSVQFQKGLYDCVAYAGQTCEIINQVK